MTITVVCGPPGSGKTTYVRKHTQYGDLIIDIDEIFRAFSGLKLYDKPENLLKFVLAARNEALNELEKSPTNSWIISSNPTKDFRENMSKRFSASIIILDVKPDICKQRIKEDPFRDLDEVWEKLIDDWWEKFNLDKTEIQEKKWKNLNEEPLMCRS